MRSALKISYTVLQAKWQEKIVYKRGQSERGQNIHPTLAAFVLARNALNENMQRRQRTASLFSAKLNIQVNQGKQLQPGYDLQVRAEQKTANSGQPEEQFECLGTRSASVGSRHSKVCNELRAL